ncbi:MAG TPA: glycosyltransferase family 9 protein, partial [Chitinophagaceae bacterium]|nr:glycosyltransferase family 9 protein [Chitinophagaceae bacterium]
MKPKHILVIRLSAMGDVAMTIPVLQQLLQQNPQIHLTVLTRQLFVPLFDSLPRTSVFPVETKGRHKGVTGLFKLYRELRKQHQFDAVADLHNVLRSKLVRFLFSSAGIKSAAIDKGRKEKKQLTAKAHKKLVPLKTGFQRYADVFNSLGFPVALNTAQQTFPRQDLPSSASSLFVSPKAKICFAPFAKHDAKMYPVEKLKNIIRNFAAKEGYQVFLLGGGKVETMALNEWEKEFGATINLSGRYSFREELAII